MNEFLQGHLEGKRIRPSSSNITSGTWMVPKSDPNAFPRVVHDYRALNSNTIKDYTPLPRQDEILEIMAKAKIRGKIDMTSAYYQIPMAESDIHKTAFKTAFGLFEWTVMAQGLCNAPATFQRYMNWILRKYIGRICSCYIDDISIWSQSIEEHKKNVRLILEALREHGMIASAMKSVLFADAIPFLGHIVSSRGIEVAEDKVNKILAAKRPESAQHIKEFNGLVNYIGQFLPGLAEWSSKLSGLTKKNVPFKWDESHETAFLNIKRLSKEAPICKPIDYTLLDPVFLVTDASKDSLGGYYGQGKDYKTMTPAGFHSRTFNPAEKNYPTHDKEMLAVVDCMKKWEPQLLGGPFKVLTDHRPLTHWTTQKDMSPRQIRWNNDVYSRFDATIEYIPGVTNTAADALSRYPFVQHSTPVTSNPSEDSEINAVSTIHFDKGILESVKACCKTDKIFAPIIQNPERFPAYQVLNDLIFMDGRLCIPTNDRRSRECLLKQYHDCQSHFGIAKTRQSITRDYYWPGISLEVEKYVKSCPSCAVNKAGTRGPAGFLHPLPIPENRFAEIAIDFVGPLAKCKGYDTLLVMTDRLTNYVRIEPTYQTATAENVATLMYKSWYRHFGLPEAITSDRDKLFTSKFWRQLHSLIGTNLRMSTSHHPETDGSSERSNKTAIEALRHYVNVRQKDWVDHLIHVETSMNNSVNATTGKSPTELLYGTTIRLFPVVNLGEATLPAVADYLEQIRESIDIAKDGHRAAKTKQTVYANQHRREDPEYNVGDKVYLESSTIRLNIKQKGRAAKFYPRFIGPYKVIEAKTKTSTYKLDLPAELGIHPWFHTKRLKLAIDNDPNLFPDREPPRPPPVIEESNEYEVERVLDHRDLRSGRQYLIHWLGYPDSDDEWIHEDNIPGKELIAEYLRELEEE